MNKVNEKQEIFFKALADIQETNVQISLINYKQGDSIENLLYSITGDIICDVMSLLDGYYNDNVKLDIIDKDTGRSIREGIELHDTCVDYIK